MVHVPHFRSAFATGTREHRLMGMAGETPFANAAELNAEANRVEARLNSDPDDVAASAEFRVTKIRLELTEANAALQAPARAALDRLVAAERARRDSRAEVTTLRGNQTTKRTEVLGQLNVAATRAAGLTEIRAEIDRSLTAIRTLSTPPASNRFASADLITAHLEHIRQLQEIAPTPNLSPLERAQLRSPLAVETAADDVSKERLGRAYLQAEGYEVAPGGTMRFLKVYPSAAGVPALPRTLLIEYRFIAGAAGAGKWQVNLNIAGLVVPAMDVTNFTRANLDAAVSAPPLNADAVAMINSTNGIARDDIARHLGIGVNVQTGINTPVPAALDTVRGKAAEAEAVRAEASLATLTAAHNTFISGPFTTAFNAAETAKTTGTGLTPEQLRTRIVTALDTPATGLRPVAAARKTELQNQIAAITNPPAGSLRPSNAVAQITELRRQIADIDAQLRQREVTLGVASAVTGPSTAPAETAEARTFKAAVDTAINPLSATSTRAQLDTAQTALGAALTALPEAQRAANQNYIVEKARAKGLTATITGTAVRLEVGTTAPSAAANTINEQLQRLRPMMELVRMFAPLIAMLNPNFNLSGLDTVLNRMDLQMQLRAAEQELAGLADTPANRDARTAVQNRITDLRNRINALPAIPSNTTGGINRLDEAGLLRFATDAAARFNAFLAPNTTTVVGNRYLLINCTGRPADVIARLNMISMRYASCRVSAGITGIPANANQAGSNIIALDVSLLYSAVGGDIERAFRNDVAGLTPPPMPLAPVTPVAPVTGPVVQANATAINGPKPTYGSSNRRVV